ncbi:MAG: hypothetical protein ABIO76_05505 [Ginsengibacter sp.]
MVKTFTLILLIAQCNYCKSQDHGGLEQYYYSSQGSSVIVPKVYYQSRNNWYGEMRYNYEELQTMSLIVGKMFSNDRSLSYSVTPLSGVVLGKFKGGLIGSNITLDYKNLFFSSEAQYTFSVEKKTEDFFFNWSELGYSFTKLLYAGVALQVTHPYELKNNWEPGLMMGLEYKSWTFPLYVFNPGAQNRNFVLGVNWEWKNITQRNN